MIKLDCLTERDVQKVRTWRNQILEVLRTPYMLTREQQQEFYSNVVCNPSSNCRFYAIRGEFDVDLLGMIGLINIQWENSTAEISIVIDPERRKNGFGSQAIDMLLSEGFNNLNLNLIYGECYKTSSGNLFFWEKVIEKYKAYRTILPQRKYYNGKYHDSIYFCISRIKFDSAIKKYF